MFEIGKFLVELDDSLGGVPVQFREVDCFIFIYNTSARLDTRSRECIVLGKFFTIGKVNKERF